MIDTPLQTFPWKNLLSWYEKNGRHTLPWRNYNHTQILYRVWLSEILLQQTQVDRVIPYFERILEAYPTIHHLAKATYDEFFPYYQGMGYYSRARNILKTAKIISEEYAGLFPQEKKLLMKLPGIGEYTSSAILSFGYGKAYLAWDTNLEKVFARYIKGSRYEKITDTEKKMIGEDFERFISENTDSELWQKSIRGINNALMDFAATIDLKNPDTINWDGYPIQSGIFYDTRGKREPREIKKSTTFPTPDAKILVILHENHKIYYSQDMNIFTSFELPPSLTRDTRKYVQEFFRDRYGLELSVRPVHKKWFSDDGVPYIAANAQIQAGKHNFYTFTKEKVRII